MDQKISVKIVGCMFNFTASSPEAEQLYREAAETINRRFAVIARNYPGKSSSDLLSMIALQETAIRLDLQQQIDQYKEEKDLLARDLERYLQDNGTK